MPPSVPIWRCLLFNIALAGWTVMSGAAILPFAITSQRGAMRIAKPFTGGALWLAKVIMGITFEIRGAEHIRYSQVVIAAKHQSALEILVLLNMFPNAAFVIKRELIFIPIFGQYLWRMGMIHINRGNKAASMKLLAEQSRRIAHQRRPIIIFPEGTRHRPGEKTRYLPGAALLYDALKLPVLPVAVNCGVYWPKPRLEKYRGTAVIEFLPIIDAGLPVRGFLRQMQKEIETASTVLYEDATKENQHETIETTSR